MKPTFPGLKELLLPRRPNRGSADIAAIGAARALFQAPESAMTKQRESLVEFLGQVSLFEDLAHRELARVARIVHEREYSDGEYICEEGRPGAALFVVRRGVVEVVQAGRRRPGRSACPARAAGVLRGVSGHRDRSHSLVLRPCAWSGLVARPRQIGPRRVDPQFPAARQQSPDQAGRHHGRATADADRCRDSERIRSAWRWHPVTATASPKRAGVVIKSVVTLAAVLLAAYLVWGLRSFIVPAFVGGLLAYICRPVVARLERGRIPRGLAVGLLLLMFGAVTLVGLNSVRAAHTKRDRGSRAARSRAVRAAPPLSGADGTRSLVDPGQWPLPVDAPRSRPADGSRE